MTKPGRIGMCHSPFVSAVFKCQCEYAVPKSSGYFSIEKNLRLRARNSCWLVGALGANSCKRASTGYGLCS